MESNLQNRSDTKDTMLATAGLAFVILGAGLIMSHPGVQRYMGNMQVGGLLKAAIPDLERYLKLRSM